MIEFSYYTETTIKTVDISCCKLCGSDPTISKGSHGYCDASIDIKCKSCGITKSTTGSFNEGGINTLYLGVINQWNRIMK